MSRHSLSYYPGGQAGTTDADWAILAASVSAILGPSGRRTDPLSAVKTWERWDEQTPAVHLRGGINPPNWRKSQCRC